MIKKEIIMNYLIMTLILLTSFNLAAMGDNKKVEMPLDCRNYIVSRYLTVTMCRDRQETNGQATQPKTAQEESFRHRIRLK